MQASKEKIFMNAGEGFLISYRLFVLMGNDGET
jgi:hypothetical protein